MNDLLQNALAFGAIIAGGAIAGFSKRTDEIGFGLVLIGGTWLGVAIINIPWSFGHPYLVFVLKTIGWFSVCLIGMIAGLLLSDLLLALRKRTKPSTGESDG